MLPGIGSILDVILRKLQGSVVPGQMLRSLNSPVDVEHGRRACSCMPTRVKEAQTQKNCKPEEGK